MYSIYSNSNKDQQLKQWGKTVEILYYYDTLQTAAANVISKKKDKPKLERKNPTDF